MAIPAPDPRPAVDAGVEVRADPAGAVAWAVTGSMEGTRVGIGGGVSGRTGAMSTMASLGHTICSFIGRCWLPGACLLCAGAAREALCDACLADLPEQSPADESLAADLPALTLWRYAEPADRVVLAFKYGGHTTVARAWATRIAPRLPKVDALVAMPMHPSRLAERGENPAVAMACALRPLLPGCPPLLQATKTRLTARQQGLDRAGRLANVADAYRIDTDLRGQRLLLVDDVLTTGASLLALAAAARTAGAGELFAVAMARTTT